MGFILEITLDVYCMAGKSITVMSNGKCTVRLDSYASHGTGVRCTGGVLSMCHQYYHTVYRVGTVEITFVFVFFVDPYIDSRQ
jgi:hypothetical protein